MSTKMKLKAAAGGGYDVLVLTRHPMETGNRKDPKTGELVPAHYIRTMLFTLNGDTVAQANLGPGISANPLIGVTITSAKAGDTIGVTWEDNNGESDSIEDAVA